MKHTVGTLVIVFLVGVFMVGCKSELRKEIEKREKEYNQKIENSMNHMEGFEGTCKGERRFELFYNDYIRHVNIVEPSTSTTEMQTANDTIKTCEGNFYIEINRNQLTDDDMKIMSLTRSRGSEQVEFDPITVINKKEVCFKVYQLACNCELTKDKVDTKCQRVENSEFDWCLPWTPRDPRHDDY